MADLPELLTPDECAERLKLTVRQVYYLCANGKLQYTRLGHRTLRIYADSVAACLEAGQESPPCT